MRRYPKDLVAESVCPAIDRTPSAGKILSAFCLASILVLAFAVGKAAATPPEFVGGFLSSEASGVAVDAGNENVFVSGEDQVTVFGSDGGAPVGVAVPVIGGFSFGVEPSGLAVDNSATSPSKGDLYVADVLNGVIKKFALNPTSEEYEQVGELTGFGEVLDVAVDSHGDVFVADYNGGVVELDPSGVELQTITSTEHPSSIAVDSAGDLFVQRYGTGNVFKYAANGSGEVEPTTVPSEVVAGGATGIAVNSTTGVLYVALGERVAEYGVSSEALLGEFGAGRLSGTERLAVNEASDRVYVADRAAGAIDIFQHVPPVAPIVVDESASARYTEASVRAKINPGHDTTTWYVEYGPTEAYGQSSASHTLTAGGEAVEARASLFGLALGTTYHYRVVASNSVTTVRGPDQVFTTLSEPPGGEGCANESVRAEQGAAALALPECRAYELVSPANAGGQRPTAEDYNLIEDAFDSQLVSPDGESIVFNTVGGSLPGTDGTGYADRYEARRGKSGWVTSLTSPSAAVFGEIEPRPGGITPQHDYYFSWDESNDESLLRTPSGFELVGQGSLGTDPTVEGNYISPAGGHVIFNSFNRPSDPTVVRLESKAPAGGTPTLYDRTSSGTRVLSLLPGDITPPEGYEAEFEGASEDGGTVAFSFDGNSDPSLYVRLDSGTTIPVARDDGVLAGDALDCEGAPGSATLGYEWLRNGTPIAAAAGSTYVTTGADAGAVVQCQVKASSAEGVTLATSTPAVSVGPYGSVAPPAYNSAAGPSISGSPTVGNSLTCQNTGAWLNEPAFAFQWLRNGTPIVGASASTYTVAAADEETAIQCEVVGSNSGGSVAIISPDAIVGTVAPPQATASVPGSPVHFAGISAHGDYVFYEQGGDVYSFNTGSETATRIVATGDAKLVNISSDGSHVYFVSDQQIGGEGSSGEPNLYVWDRETTTTTFIAAVSAADAAGTAHPVPWYGEDFQPSLVGWTKYVATGDKGFENGAGSELSRTTPDGRTIVFESDAKLTDFENAGHVEVYLYQDGDSGPTCVSCGSGTGPATADASLQSFAQIGSGDHTRPLGAVYPTANLSDDGKTVVFQSEEAIVSGDGDGKQDVYRWKGGEVALLSSGRSAANDYLYAVSPTARDVIFLTGDNLLPEDENGGVGALYDARAGGGFPGAASESAACVEDSCHGQPGTAPSLQAPASSNFNAKPSPKPRRHHKHKRKHRSKGRHSGKRHRQTQRAHPARGSFGDSR